jgi:uncharacterized protein (TIGR02300 family)
MANARQIHGQTQILEADGVAKPEWGVKRICTNCQSRFYDLQKNPIECPSCGTTFDPEVFAKPKRARSAAPSEAARKAAAAEAEKRKKAKEAEAEGDDDDELDDDIDDDLDDDIEDEDDEGVLEDASDLGEDDDDVAEVLENVDDKNKEEG